MNATALFQNIHGSIDISRWKKMKDHPEIIPTETFNDAVKYLDISPDDVYYDPYHFLNQCVYHKGFVHVNLYDMTMNTLKGLRIKNIIEQQTKHFEELLNENDYESLFNLIDKPFLIPTFIEMYQEIPKELVYDIFIHLYSRSEYGFEKLPKEILLDLKNKSVYSKERGERMEVLKKKLKKEKFLVYRGEGTLSTSTNSALSWTLSRKTAEWFAKRFRSKGRIARKSIAFDDVLDYLNDRSEQEILIIPENM